MKKCPECDGPEHPSWRAHVFNTVTHDVTHAAKAVTHATNGRTNADRQAKWRKAHLEERREYMRFWRAVKAGKVCVWPR